MQVFLIGIFCTPRKRTATRDGSASITHLLSFTLVKHTQILHILVKQTHRSHENFSFPSVLLSDPPPPPPPPPAIIFSGSPAQVMVSQWSPWSTMAARSIFSLLLNPRWRWWVVAMVVVDLGQPKSSDS
ncbi:hypothetical protein L1987_82672 [Smallanthus sonchifolius]|uniref:Uncharacterized protein n=1 Tax=Smallanthus sonchifolius TaxID=185202 RepID=A0ACB8YAB3_9ASTR|nr:hypothetical protein L1987_82672 [Smallanthus sonchifolius]